MNYLAHLFLSGRTPEAVVGGLLGDFVKGSVDGRYGERVRQGILLHRKIDRYTDDHEVVTASRRLISPLRRRFAGIMVDVFYDHFLARHWTNFAEAPLGEFAREVYSILECHHEQFPERLQYIVPRMVRDDWLVSYSELWRVRAALDGISRRLRRNNTLAGGADELETHYDELEAHFLCFFPQLMCFVDSYKSQQGISGPSVWKHGA
ncbi:MAG: ACP phosphodiesterase [Acidiferrobacterales bacterium]|nr:ACP phosphodiesterase [Acidiferrobacterales bacterium]